MTTITSTIFHFPKIIGTIIKNTPTLDPLVIVLNAEVFVGMQNNQIIGFVSIKKFGTTIEMGTLFIYPEFRKQGHAEQLLKEVLTTYPNMSLLCKPDLVDFYSRFGFSTVDQPTGVIKLRKKLFDFFIAPFTRYRIVVMETK